MDRSNQIYMDHPAPSAGLLFIILGVVCVCLYVVIFSWKITKSPIDVFVIVVSGIVGLICSFYLWPLYSTYYWIDSEGLRVKYGPWDNYFKWDSFEKAFLQKGLVTSRIGLPTITPCVRLTDALVLVKKKYKLSPYLHLTPNDTEKLLKKVSELAPQLTKEIIM